MVAGVLDLRQRENRADRTGTVDDLYDSATTKRYLAQAVGVAGLVTAGVAVWLFLREPDERPTTMTRGSHVVFSPAGIAIIGSF